MRLFISARRVEKFQSEKTLLNSGIKEDRNENNRILLVNNMYISCMHYFKQPYAFNFYWKYYFLCMFLFYFNNILFTIRKMNRNKNPGGLGRGRKEGVSLKFEVF